MHNMFAYFDSKKGLIWHEKIIHSILQEDLGSDGVVYNKLQEAMKEAENLKNEAYEESCKRRKAELNAVLAFQKVYLFHHKSSWYNISLECMIYSS